MSRKLYRTWASISGPNSFGLGYIGPREVPPFKDSYLDNERVVLMPEMFLSKGIKRREGQGRGRMDPDSRHTVSNSRTIK
ncbi:hypothetical protein CR513_26730, partial [Mucuna pruriens]